MQPARRTCNGSRKDGSPCQGPAVTGSDRCRMHLGRKAEDVITEAKVRDLTATYGLPVETTPEQAILDEVQRTAGHVAWLQEQVRALTKGELVWGMTKAKEGGHDGGITEEAVPNAFLRLYQEERKHLVTVCAAALRAGIEERRVKLAEQQGALVAQVIRAILGDLKLTSEQREMIPEVVPRHLRALAS